MSLLKLISSILCLAALSGCSTPPPAVPIPTVHLTPPASLMMRPAPLLLLMPPASSQKTMGNIAQ